MKVFLRLNTGILTKSINIPDHCLRTEFLLPWAPPIKLADVSSIQEFSIAEFTVPVMVFQWDRNSYWGNSGHPIMDLVDVRK